jgi:hypothetical protein
MTSVDSQWAARVGCSVGADTCSASVPVEVPRSRQMVLDVLEAKRRHGVDRMTAGEIREVLEAVHAPRRFDKGWVTGRLSELLESDLVACLDEHKVDPRTKRSSQLWCLPMVQLRLVV